MMDKPKINSVIGVLSVVAVLVLAGNASGAWTQAQKIYEAGGQAGDVFGIATGVSGDTAIVSARGDEKAFIWQRGLDGSWAQLGGALASDVPTGGDQFGFDVRISGDLAIVGSRFDDDRAENAGAAFIFRRNGTDTWVREAKLYASDASAWGIFGQSVDISGDYAIVGTASAKAYIFHRGQNGTWSQEHLISDCGYAVGIHGTTAVVTKYNDSARVYSRDAGTGTWMQEGGNLTSGVSGDEFGVQARIDGDFLVVGAPGDGSNAEGAAYIYERVVDGDTVSWANQTRLTSAVRINDAHFGRYVDIAAESVVLGTWSGGTGDEGAYVFDYEGSTWSQTARLESDDPLAGENFGVGVSIEAGIVIVGEQSGDGAVADSGAAYVFVPEPGTLAMVAIGGIGALVRRRRR